MAVTWNTLNNYRWCNKCQGLWLGTNQAASTCPEGGTHNNVGSGNYSLVRNATTTPANHQSGWRWCNKCHGLWFGPNQAASTCPEGGTHSLTGSGNYSLAFNAGAGQANWRWCNKCQGLWFGPNQAASTCPEGGTHSQAGSGNYRLPIVTSRVRVHVKILTTPNIAIATLFQNMREVYASCGIDVSWASEEILNLPALNIVDVGACTLGNTTAEQNQLFANRNFAAANDIVLYFVEATSPPFNGCAAHPAARPGAVVVRTATQWTFAHEQGHVLGLFHVNNNDRLMTGNGTANITNPPPDLVASECSTMQASPITVNV
jgi:hypothetical protein